MTAQNEGYKIMPPMDPKYTERSGLEGPFTTLSGKVVYYDPKEGKYYDPDTDMYMSYDEFQNYDKDYSGMGEGHSPHKKGSAKYKAHMAAKHASMNEGEEKPYICVHAKKGKHECRAESSYGAAKKAAAHWGMKSTAGIDAYLADVKHVAETLSPEDKALVNKMYNKDGTLTALGKRVMGTKESRTLENLMAKVFGKTVNEFKNSTIEAEVQVDEAGGYYTQPVYDMIKQHGYPKVMHKLLTSLDADIIQDFLNRAELNEASETKYGIVRYPDTAISYIKNDGNGWEHIYDKSYGFEGPVDKNDIQYASKIEKEKIPSRMFKEGRLSHSDIPSRYAVK